MIAPKRMRSYFAAPLFNEMERRNNLEVVEKIEPLTDVFLPQRDGGLLVKLVSQGIPVAAAEQRIFEKDLAAIEHADLIVAILDGAHIDEGVAFEIGFAFALGKPCVGLQTDSRRQLPTGNNPMLSKSLSCIFHTQEHLIEWLRHFVANELHVTRQLARTNGRLATQPFCE